MPSLAEIYKLAPTKINILLFLKNNSEKEFSRLEVGTAINPHRKDARYKESIRVGLRKLVKDGNIIMRVVDNVQKFKCKSNTKS